MRASILLIPYEKTDPAVLSNGKYGRKGSVLATASCTIPEGRQVESCVAEVCRYSDTNECMPNLGDITNYLNKHK